jgi:hypothetical protein
LEGKSHPVLLPFSALPPLSRLLNLGFSPLCFSASFSPARSSSRSFTLIAGPSYATSCQWTSWGFTPSIYMLDVSRNN